MDIAVELTDVAKAYGDTRVLDGLNLSVATGSFTVVFGVPGSGKSVVVRLLAGLEEPDAGEVSLRGEPAHGVDPASRNIGYVPQSFALFPHYSVRRNIGYPLEIQRVDKATIAAKVEHTAATLRIEPLLDKSPDQLSGGEKQRVAIARGLVKDTDLFVLDDPLTGLDFKLREQLIEDLRDMQAQLGATFVYTTSEPLEALLLAEQLVVIEGGRVVEAGPTWNLYHDPQQVTTAHLVGYPRCSLLPGSLAVDGDDARCDTAVFSMPLTMVDGAVPTSDVLVAVRPEGVRIDADPPPSGSVRFGARMLLAEDLGSESIIHLDSEGIQVVTVVPDGEPVPAIDAQVDVSVEASAVSVFDVATGRLVGKGQGGNRG